MYHNEEDKTELRSWLKRQYLGKYSSLQSYRQTGRGHSLEWPYSWFKGRVLAFLAKSKGLLFLLLRMIPNNTHFDFIYFRLVDMLYVIFIFLGYRQDLITARIEINEK